MAKSTKSKSYGIKLFDDTFVPILQKGEKENRKVILTTVRDNQKMTIIEVYEGTSAKCINNKYLGKLVIPFGRETEKGEPEVEVYMRLDENNILFAKAKDKISGERNEIKINLDSIDSDNIQETVFEDKTKINEEEATQLANYSNKNELNPYLRLALLIIAIIVALGLLAAGGWLGYNIFFANKQIVKKDTNNSSSKQSHSSSVLSKSSQETNVTGIRDKEGKKHYIRWGDNLWNICKKYYGDPWYYPALAEYNNIKKPRLIFAGTNIIIPPKSSIKRWQFLE